MGKQTVNKRWYGMGVHSQFEREMHHIEESHANGDMSDSEYTTEMNELEKDFQRCAEESAQDAYDAEMRNW